MPERTPGHSLDVLFLAGRTPPSIGGRESVMRELLCRQPPDRSRLVAPRAPGAGAFDRGAGIEVRRRPAWTFLGEAAGRWIRRTHLDWVTRRRRPDLLLAFGLGPEASLARETKRATGAPYLLHVEGPELHAARRALRAGVDRARALRDILDECEALVVASRACRLEAHKAGVLPHRIEVIPPGVDTERFRPGPGGDDLARKAGTGRGPVLLTVAGRGPAKDPDTLLRAFASIRGQRGNATLLIVGPVDPSWRACAGRLRLGNAVRFVGAVPEPELPSWYRLADLFLHAHREDREAGVVAGVEVAIAEALASGVPVAATAVPPLEEHAPSEEVGLLVEPGAHAQLARAALELLGDAERRERMSEAARRRATVEHPADVTAARFREILEVVWFRRLGRGRLDHAEDAAPAELPAA